VTSLVSNVNVTSAENVYMGASRTATDPGVTTRAAGIVGTQQETEPVVPLATDVACSGVWKGFPISGACKVSRYIKQI